MKTSPEDARRRFHQVKLSILRLFHSSSSRANTVNQGRLTLGWRISRVTMPGSKKTKGSG
jgi:hypothetical protein